MIIRNEETGRFVIGALFRRERDTSGPELQLSSDAAAAIGVLAGDPTMLNVTALRREEVAETADAAPDATAPGIDTGALAASAAGGEITASPLDTGDSTIAAAAAAIDAAEAAPIPTPPAPLPQGRRNGPMSRSASSLCKKTPPTQGRPCVGSDLSRQYMTRPPTDASSGASSWGQPIARPPAMRSWKAFGGLGLTMPFL